MSRLENKVVAVTGGAGLIGRRACNAILQAGGKVIIADVNSEAAEKTGAESGYARDLDWISLPVDVTSCESVDSLINSSVKTFGGIDALLNCAYPRSGNFMRDFFETDFTDFCTDLNLQLGSLFLLAQRFALYFRDLKAGNIINFSSVYGIVAPKFEIYKETGLTMPPSYAAVKSSIIHLTRYLAKRLNDLNIRVNAISPGGVFNGHSERFVSQYGKYSFHASMLNVDDLAGAILFLLSDESRFINGQNIVVDDGFTL